MGMDFVAIDFETANGHAGSACSVGLVRIRDGFVDATESFLIRPDDSLGPFGAGNINVHGITPEMIDEADAPSWSESVTRIKDFIGSDYVIAHNAGFDSTVIRSASTVAGVTIPNMSFHCSVKLARKLYPDFPNHKLPTVIEQLGLESFAHHDAGADALASAMICVESAIRFQHTDLEEMMHAHGFDPILVGMGRDFAVWNRQPAVVAG
jgi:DNA polymerase-3 subunit epsilon